MTVFKIIWIINVIAALIVLYFFVTGIMDGSITHRNIKLWLFIILALACIVGGSILLRQEGYNKAAMLLSLVLAIPAIGYGLFILLNIFGNNKWN